MTPTLGFQMLLAVLIAALFKKNKIAAVLGVWISNPLTAPFIYLAEYEFCRYLLGWDRISLPTHLTLNEMLTLGWEVMFPLWLGGLVFGIVGGVFAYFFTLKMVPIAKTCRIPRWPRAHRKNGRQSEIIPESVSYDLAIAQVIALPKYYKNYRRTYGCAQIFEIFI